MYDRTYQLFEYYGAVPGHVSNIKEIYMPCDQGMYISNIKGKYMPSVLRAVLYRIYSDYRYL